MNIKILDLTDSNEKQCLTINSRGLINVQQNHQCGYNRNPTISEICANTFFAPVHYSHNQIPYLELCVSLTAINASLHKSRQVLLVNIEFVLLIFHHQKNSLCLVTNIAN
jgi:hypothetical protein